MKFGKTFNELCTPARVYFFISAITIVIGLFSGFQLLAVFMKIGFVLVWTYILNLLCKKGFKPLSWFLVLLPYFLILIGFLMTLGNIREGISEGELRKLREEAEAPWMRMKQRFGRQQDKARAEQAEDMEKLRQKRRQEEDEAARRYGQHFDNERKYR
jgi:cytochrome b subunit of formate dehydrogenase